MQEQNLYCPKCGIKYRNDAQLCYKCGLLFPVFVSEKDRCEWLEQIIIPEEGWADLYLQIKNGNPTALSKLTTLAEYGHVGGMGILATLYERGENVQKDIKKAISLYCKAAEKAETGMCDAAVAI